MACDCSDGLRTEYLSLYRGFGDAPIDSIPYYQKYCTCELGQRRRADLDSVGSKRATGPGSGAIPNVTRLIYYRMAALAIPPGGGVFDAVAILANKDAARGAEELAREWVAAALVAVRHAAEPNSWKDSDDECIAGELLRRIDDRAVASWRRSDVKGTEATKGTEGTNL